jgi:hypothetical protein
MFCGFYVFQMFRVHLDEVNGPLEGSNRDNNFVVGATLNLLDVIALPASSHRNYLPHSEAGRPLPQPARQEL